MSIKLSWVNKNTQSVTTTIYRGDTKLDRANLPAPLVTLTNNETSYIDTTAVQGNTYYYVFKTTNGNETIISRNQAIQAAETRGPGSNTFMFGDRELGLYDVISSDAFINVTNLNALVGNVSASLNTSTVTWYKYARRGKVYMVPDRVLAFSVGWNTLQAKNLVDGLVVQIVGYNWKVRLMRGWSEVDSGLALPSKTLGSVDMSTYTQTNEFNDFVYPMAAPTPPTQRLPNWSQQTVASLYSSSNGPVVVCAEKVLEGDMIAARSFITITTSERTKLSGAVFNSYSVSSNPAVLGWWPVLELVEA